MEDTIGYEALFSAEEWNSIDLGTWETPKHTVTVWYPPGQYEGNEERFELECDVCDYIGAADSVDEAETQARLHEVLKATEVQA